MEQEWRKEVEKIFNDAGVIIEWRDNYAECSYSHTLDEDFYFTIRGNNLADFCFNFGNYYADFPEKHNMTKNAQMFDEVLAQLDDELGNLFNKIG